MNRLFILFQYLVPQHSISRLAGKLAASHLIRRIFIGLFIRRYRVDMSEALHEDPHYYQNFNEFFTRELKPGVRPIAEGHGAIVSPADGVISQLGKIEDNRLIQAKGRNFTLQKLLGDDEHSARAFLDGEFATVYLAPKDYHRVHMPISGQLLQMTYLPGGLFSVNQHTANSVPDLFARNERLVCQFETEAGPMALVLVGAMIVAAIDTVWAGQVCPHAGKREPFTVDYRDRSPPIYLQKGEEMGQFRLGSTVIVLFGAGAISLEPALRAENKIAMGQLIAKIRH